MNFELTRGVKIAIVLIGFVVVSMTANTDEVDNKVETDKGNPPIAQQKQEPIINSKSFDDFNIVCDSSATSLQKEDLFDRNFKNKYVEWTGTVSSISESFGAYTLQVKHCPNTFTSDIVIRMNDNQKEKLLSYSEGSQITYRAKLTDIGDFMGLSASEGIVIN